MNVYAFGDSLQEHLLTLKGEGAQARILEAYSLSLAAQPDFPTVQQADAKALIAKANTRLGVARDHAAHYLNKVQPVVIRTVGDMHNYFQAQLTFSEAMVSSKSNAEVGRIFDLLLGKLEGYREDASNVERLLIQVRGDFTHDQRAFAEVQSDAKVLVGQQQSLLVDREGQLTRVENSIQELHRKRVLGILGIIGGALLVVVGSVVTGGIAAPALVTGGVGMLATGVGSLGTGIAGYSNLMKEKRDLIGEIQRLNESVGVLTGMEKAFGSFGDSAQIAVEAAQAMVNSWAFLGDSLSQLSKDLKDDREYIDLLRNELISMAKMGVDRVGADLKIVRDQLRGAGQSVANARPGETIDQAVQRVAAERNAK